MKLSSSQTSEKMDFKASRKWRNHGEETRGDSIKTSPCASDSGPNLVFRPVLGRPALLSGVSPSLSPGRPTPTELFALTRPVTDPRTPPPAGSALVLDAPASLGPDPVCPEVTGSAPSEEEQPGEDRARPGRAASAGASGSVHLGSPPGVDVCTIRKASEPLQVGLRGGLLTWPWSLGPLPARLPVPGGWGGAEDPKLLLVAWCSW